VPAEAVGRGLDRPVSRDDRGRFAWVQLHGEPGAVGAREHEALAPDPEGRLASGVDVDALGPRQPGRDPFETGPATEVTYRDER
jgi:hypothetical protein